MLYKIGYRDALGIVMGNIGPLDWEEVKLDGLLGRILAEEVVAAVDSPSLDASLKDGYAVCPPDLDTASEESPVCLDLQGFVHAGSTGQKPLERGQAVRVTTGAALPPGAGAVLAGEYAREESGRIWCTRDAESGRNVLPRGTDIKKGQVVAGVGQELRPALIGLLAAAGVDRAKVARRPRVAVIGTGDEVVAPGCHLPEGKLYASNIVETMSWLRSFSISELKSRTVPDQKGDIKGAILEMSTEVDAFVTSGGAWRSERDLMIGIMESLGWEGFFHRITLGPGKAVAFGLFQGKPFFILPGGPPSHEAAFLLLALPGILALAGRRGPVFPVIRATLKRAISGDTGWTQCIHAVVSFEDGQWVAEPIKSASRLSSMARKNAYILLEEGVAEIPSGGEVEATILDGANVFI